MLVRQVAWVSRPDEREVKDQSIQENYRFSELWFVRAVLFT